MITHCNALNIRYLDWITPSIWIIFVDEPVMSLLMSSKVSFIAKLSLFVHVDLCDGTVHQRYDVLKNPGESGRTRENLGEPGPKII